MATQVRKSKDLTLSDILSRLSFTQACNLLGGVEVGKRRLYAGGKMPVENFDEQVYLQGDLFRLSLPTEGAIVTLTVSSSHTRRLVMNCDQCDFLCDHLGAAFSLILDSKTALGLAKPPDERPPVAPQSEEQLLEAALAERTLRAKEEKMTVVSTVPDSKSPWCDYLVTSRLTGRTYRVALRGTERGDSYCTCPDFRTNTLGTCKHILHALQKIRRRFDPQAFQRKPRQKETSVYLKYGTELALRLGAPSRLSDGAARIIGPIQDADISDVNDLIQRISRLESLGEPVIVYPDAEEFIQKQLFQKHMEQLVQEIRRSPGSHPLRTSLLKVELLPYQMDGIAFAAEAGRAILADDMGLGKTIQGVGVAELLAREAGIERVLVICPTSLKAQWRNEIERFCDRSCQLVMGASGDRARQYSSDTFFTVCNYEQVLKDIQDIERVRWDLIILDEGQRIKNWEAQTTRIVKSLRSRFALVLSGTPLENRLDELYSVVQFVDDRLLGPGFRFFNHHRIVDERGKVLGYRNLSELREKLKPVLLRRTRDLVMKDLPPRVTEFVRIPPTDEQMELHAANMRIVASITRKRFISEMDLLKLRQALLMCRLVANSTFLVDRQPPGCSTKLQHLDELFEQLFVEGSHKAVLFSEWTKMLDLIEPLLKKRGVSFVRLEGKVPQKERQKLVSEFQNNPDCRVFLSTNAGSTGLNLQAADTIINVDLPWNPAVLEQRIGRAHRMGQKRPVTVYILVTEDTIEDQLLTTIAHKKELALAALDVDSDIDELTMKTGMDELKAKLEILLGAVPEGHLDESLRRDREREADRLQRRENLAAAGGQLLTATFGFLGQMLPQAGKPAPPETVSLIQEQLLQAAETDERGQKSLRIQLPSEDALAQFAETLARLMQLKAPEPGN